MQGFEQSVGFFASVVECLHFPQKNNFEYELDEIEVRSLLANELDVHNIRIIPLLLLLL